MKSLDIIIPVYNDFSGLNRLLNSIKVQKFNKSLLHIYVIDDGSSINYDLSEYKDLNIVYRKQENGKQGKARNHGLRISSSDYTWFCDSDDVIIDGSINMILDDIKSIESDIIVYQAECLDADIFSKNVKCESKDDYIEGLSLNRTIVAPWNKIYNRDYLVKNKILFPENLAYEDLYHAICSACVCDKITFKNECIYRYYINDGSTTNTFDERIFDVFSVAEKIFYDLDKKIGRQSKRNIYMTHVVKYTLYRIYKSRSLSLFFSFFYFGHIKRLWRMGVNIFK